MTVKMSETKIGKYLLCGRQISGTKTAPKGHLCVFNANLCTKSHGKFWFGDIDLMEPDDLQALYQWADDLGEYIYVLREMDCRFQNEDEPRFENAVAIISPGGKLKIVKE